MQQFSRIGTSGTNVSSERESEDESALHQDDTAMANYFNRRGAEFGEKYWRKSMNLDSSVDYYDEGLPQMAKQKLESARNEIVIDFMLPANLARLIKNLSYWFRVI